MGLHLIDTLDTTLLFLLLVGLTGIERLVELRVGKKNRQWSLQQGGVEFGQGHWPWMVALHTLFLFSMVGEVLLFPTAPMPLWSILMLGVALSAQALRWWCIRSLGPHWNPRVIIVPGSKRITTGPYRWLKHPNYIAVALEGIALPMVHFCWITAIGFTIANAFLMAVRIRCENDALRQLDGHES